MLAKVAKDSEEIVYMSVDDFLDKYIRKERNGVVRHTSPESREWARYGRPWTYFRIGQDLFVQAPEENDEKVKATCSRSLARS